MPQQQQALNLNEYFADVLAVRHKSERVFYVVALKDGRRQRLHRAVADSL